MSDQGGEVTCNLINRLTYNEGVEKLGKWGGGLTRKKKFHTQAIRYLIKKEKEIIKKKKLRYLERKGF